MFVNSHIIVKQKRIPKEITDLGSYFAAAKCWGVVHDPAKLPGDSYVVHFWVMTCSLLIKGYNKTYYPKKNYTGVSR